MQRNTIDIWTAEGNKAGSVNIDKYHLVKEFIIKHLESNNQVTLADLLDGAKESLSNNFHSEELSFLLLRVKGDLEARGVLQKQWELGRIQILRLKKRFIKLKN